MSTKLTEGAIEAIVSGNPCDSPFFQILSSKQITSGTGSDRYRLLVSDGKHSYSHVMLATQLNSKMETGEMDNLCVVKVNQYICNTLQGERRVMILLEVEVVTKGADVGGKIGNPQAFKPGQQQPAAPSNSTPAEQNDVKPAIGSLANGHKSPPSNKAAFNIKPGTPGTPGSSRIHGIASLTPYQNRWRIRARVTQKSNIRTWSNSRGEGRLFSVNLLDESGEIRATGFTDVVDKYYEMLEVNKVYYFSKATLKTANKQYSSLKNDYEMTFNSDTIIEPCEEQTDLPTMNFDFVKIDALESKQANSIIDVLGVVKSAADLSTVVGKQSKKEIAKRDVQLVDQSGMVVNLTLWGTDAENFNGSDNPVIACKGCRLSDWGGRSLSVLSSSQMIVNPDMREAHLLKGWWQREGQNREYQSYKSEGGSTGGGTNWKTFAQLKDENIGQGEKPDYFTSKGTVVFFRKENCMYMACPKEDCNKKVIDQSNDTYRCEKCQQEYPNYKWRMILSANLCDHTGQQWVTCFQESAEYILGIKADELGHLKSTNENQFDQVFVDANFKSYIFRLRAKVETYNDESRLKTVCVKASAVDFIEDGQRLLNEINNMLK
ncbi:60S acidic ribosomal protein P1 [Mactra antiquata]